MLRDERTFDPLPAVDLLVCLTADPVAVASGGVGTPAPEPSEAPDV